MPPDAVALVEGAEGQIRTRVRVLRVDGELLKVPLRLVYVVERLVRQRDRARAECVSGRRALLMWRSDAPTHRRFETYDPC